MKLIPDLFTNWSIVGNAERVRSGGELKYRYLKLEAGTDALDEMVSRSMLGNNWLHGQFHNLDPNTNLTDEARSSSCSKVSTVFT